MRYRTQASALGPMEDDRGGVITVFPIFGLWFLVIVSRHSGTTYGAQLESDEWLHVYAKLAAFPPCANQFVSRRSSDLRIGKSLPARQVAFAVECRAGYPLLHPLA